MSAETKKLYAQFREAGYRPHYALSAARTLRLYNALEEHTARITAKPEEESYFDVFGEPDGYQNKYGRWITPEEERAEIIDEIERTGNWCVMAQVYKECPVCGRGEWHTVDAVGMCTGYDDPTSPLENGYVIDLMQAALNELAK